MGLIENICAREILDSRGNPTAEVEVLLDNGITAALFRAVLPQVFMKPWNWVTGIRTVTSVKAS